MTPHWRCAGSVASDSAKVELVVKKVSQVVSGQVWLTVPSSLKPLV